MKWLKKLIAKFKKSGKVNVCPFNEDGHFEGDIVSPKKDCKLKCPCC